MVLQSYIHEYTHIFFLLIQGYPFFFPFFENSNKVGAVCRWISFSTETLRKRRNRKKRRLPLPQSMAQSPSSQAWGRPTSGLPTSGFLMLVLYLLLLFPRCLLLIGPQLKVRTSSTFSFVSVPSIFSGIFSLIAVANLTRILSVNWTLVFYTAYILSKEPGGDGLIWWVGNFTST